MRIKLSLLLTLLSLLSPGVTTVSGRVGGAEYTIQVGSFSDSAQAQQLVIQLQRRGEQVTTAAVNLAGRGTWTRVLVGRFASPAAARTHAENLLRSGLIFEFLIRSAERLPTMSAATLNRGARTVASANLSDRTAFHPQINDRESSLSLHGSTGAASRFRDGGRRRWTPESPSSISPPEKRPFTRNPLPVARSFPVPPAADVRLFMRSDPVRLAFTLINCGGTRCSAAQRGGLWVTGDTLEALSRLQWIAGADSAELVGLDADGRVKLDPQLLARAARVVDVPILEAPLAVTNYIYSNEGLLLLVQLTQGSHRYRLHIARQAPTRGAEVEVTGGLNLDNNFDSRINPHRRFGKKLDNERPPDGYDSLVAINPVAVWFNQLTSQVVPVGHITFHEMAEAHAKLELGLDYLSAAGEPGAHDIALRREERLKSQRPLSGVVITAGSNRVLRSEEEARQFFSRPISQRR